MPKETETEKTRLFCHILIIGGIWIGRGDGLSALPPGTFTVRSNAALRTRTPKKLSCFVELEKIIFLNSNKTVLIQKKIKWLSRKILVIDHPCEFRLLFSFTCFMLHGDLENSLNLKKERLSWKVYLVYFCQLELKKLDILAKLELEKIILENSD